MKTEETGTGAGGGEHVGPLLDAYRTDELDAGARAAVEAHLEACDRCREDLAALGPWTAAVERGYAALREEGRELEPDWAGQRAAVIARTSGRRSRPREGLSFRRWAPQVALVAVAALIVGVVWWERAGGPGGEPVVSTSERQAGGSRTAAAPEERAAAPGRSDEDASGFAREEPRGEVAPPQPAPEAGREAGRDALADAAPPAAPPAAARAAPEEKALARELPEADEPVLAEGLPLGKMAEAEAARFERDARAALGARDTAAARRALALWSDTLAPAEADRHAALADSLREFLAPE